MGIVQGTNPFHILRSCYNHNVFLDAKRLIRYGVKEARFTCHRIFNFSIDLSCAFVKLVSIALFIFLVRPVEARTTQRAKYREYHRNNF